jgi:outer membrane receptor protein involved in Fe transport
VNIKTLFGTAFRVPSFSETFITREAQGSAAREELVVEELRTFEIGVGYKPADWLVGEVNYFYTDMNELAELADEGERHESYPIETTRTYENVGGIEVQGVEFEIRGSSEKQIGLGILPRIIGSSFRLNYSYQHPEDSMTHEKIPNMARHKGNIGIGINLSAEHSGSDVPGLFRSFSDEFSLYTNVFLCGKRERSEEDIREDLPGFAIVDVTLTAHDVLHKRLGLSLKIENLFDIDYRDPTSEFAPEEMFSTTLDDYPNPGRAIFLELRYTF